MKKSLAALIVICGLMLFAGSGWSYSVGEEDVGALDRYVSRALLPNSGAATEDSWVESLKLDGYDGGVTLEYLSNAWGPTDESSNIVAVDFGNYTPDYFFVKIGGGNEPQYDHILFKNVAELNWGVIELRRLGDYTIENVGKISHTEGFGDPSTSVPEPTSLLLLGLGLIGVGAVARRKIKK